MGLEVVGKALPGVGAGGAISGGDTFMLGDTELDGIVQTEDEGDLTFMKGLTAAALPVASPASAGLLGLYFFNCFEGGVLFNWGIKTDVPPSVTFYGSKNNMGEALDGLERVSVKPLDVTCLPSIELEINGQKLPALLDTGSPISVLNAEAAKITGVDTTIEAEDDSSNPFAQLTRGFKSAQAAARGDVLLIAGAAGERIELVKSKDPVDVAIGNEIALGKQNLYVGDLPGLAALGGLGKDAPPAAVLGMDILRTRPKMLYRSNEIYL